MIDLFDRLKALQAAMTKGPWQCIGFEVRYGSGGNKRIATVHLSDKTSAETKANATVIALGDLVPDLVTALQWFITRDERLEQDSGEFHDRARALLAQIAERLT